MTGDQLCGAIERALANGDGDAKTRLLLRCAVREMVRLQKDGDRLRTENLELFRALWKGEQ